MSWAWFFRFFADGSCWEQREDFQTNNWKIRRNAARTGTRVHNHHSRKRENGFQTATRRTYAGNFVHQSQGSDHVMCKRLQITSHCFRPQSSQQHTNRVQYIPCCNEKCFGMKYGSNLVTTKIRMDDKVCGSVYGDTILLLPAFRLTVVLKVPRLRIPRGRKNRP